MNSVEQLKSQLSIKAKIYWLFILTIALCSIAIIPLVLIQGTVINKNIQKNIIQTAVTLIEDRLAQDLTKINVVEINKTTSQLKNALSITSLCLFNREMIVVYAISSECNHNTLPFTLPIKNSDQSVAGYVYANPKFYGQRGFEYQILSIGLFILLLVIAAIIIALKLKRMVTEPLEELSYAVNEFMASNDYHVRARKRSNDEIGQLCESFNRMLNNMRKKEHDLIKAKNEADEANQLKGNFLASVSHEIRTPMNGIIGTTELLIESLEKQKQKNYASTILRSSESLLAIINDILDFSKIESGKLEFELISFNLYSEIEDVADLMAMRANEKNIEIILAISPYVPEFVIGDPSRLRQVLNNLVGNAIKFTARGHIIIEVDSVASSTGNNRYENLRFSIVDTGIGISDEAQQRIFERFTQAESSITRQYGGTGLGLAICKQLVELQGGNIQVESLVGKGSTFSFCLGMQIDSNHQEEALNDRLEGINVLVVDDNPYFLEYMKLTLRYCGMRVMCVSGSNEALRLIDNANESGSPFGVILIDDDMPNVSGCALAEKIRITFLESAPPIIMLNSINADTRYEETYSKLGITCCIQKPVRLRQLTSLIELALKASAVGRRNQVLTVDELRTSFANKSNIAKFANPTILIAELNDIHYQFMASFLTKVGCNVARASGSEEVIAYGFENRIDLLIIDMDLVAHTDLKLVEAIAKIQVEPSGIHIPVIATASNREDFECLKNYPNLVIDVFLQKHNIRTQLLSKVAISIPRFFINAKNELVYFENTRLLLVEDNRVNAQIATEILEEFGCTVEVCENGKLALEKFKCTHYDAILMDCQMPIMDGFESTRHIRHFEKTQKSAQTPIIALTANAMKGDSERCFIAGMDDYITKPIKRDKLRAILSRYVDASKIEIKVLSKENPNNQLISQEVFKRMFNFIRLAGIDFNHYVSDINNCLSLIDKQLLSQPAHIIYESVQSVAQMSELFGYERLNKKLLDLAQVALDLHAAKSHNNEELVVLFKKCKLVGDETNEQVHLLLSKINSDIPLPLVDEIDESHLDEAKSDSKADLKPEFKMFSEKKRDVSGLVDQATFNATKGIFKMKFNKVIAEYLEDSDDYLNQIQLGVSSQDFSVVRDSAHPLKSSSYTLGLCGMGDIAKRIETCAKVAENFAEIEADLIRLLSVFNDTKSFLHSRSINDV